MAPGRRCGRKLLIAGTSSLTGTARITTSQRAEYAPEQLRLVLTTMSARLVDEASITLPLLGRTLTAEEIAADGVLSGQLRAAIGALIEAVAAA